MIRNSSALKKLQPPSLEQTCRRYLEIVRPLVSENAFLQTERLVQDFLAHDGPLLQQQLAQPTSDTTDNYVAKFWRDMYLQAREPLSPYHNPALLCRLPTAISTRRFSRRAAVIAASALELARQIQSKSFGSDSERGNPLCDAQYEFMFGSIRLPGERRDRIVRTSGNKHFVVAHGGNLFKIAAPDNGRHSVGEIETAIAEILRTPSTELGLGILTTLPRTEWATLRRRLRRAPSTRDTLRTIDTAAFVLCLEPDTSANPAILANRILHEHASNRWYDKVLQLVVFEQPFFGINMEHSAVDGHACALLAQKICDRLPYMDLLTPSPLPRLMPIAPLAWDREACAIDLRRAQTARATCCRGLRTVVVKWQSPADLSTLDHAIQLAIQLSYLKLTGTITSVYKPVHMRRFVDGRTEAVHPVTPSSLAFCRRLLAGAATSELSGLAYRAMEEMTTRAAHSRKGEGINRHLFALQRVAQQLGRMPALFADATYQAVLGPTVLCSSSVRVHPQTNGDIPNLELLAFAPVRADGFGIGYIPQRGHTLVAITGYRDDTAHFAALLEESIGVVFETLMQPTDAVTPTLTRSADRHVRQGR
ncbi:MAG: choline/carnitine O-acyltransferase [Gammaproteobacteria bacterium]|nr:choline/carnitine O-acyltransferase [Gammaproteobacteria bacterium]